MSLNLSYDYYANQQGDAHLYYAQCKNNRMNGWKYLYDSGSHEKVLQFVEQAQKRGEELLKTGESYYQRHYKNMKYRILKVDIEQLQCF
jgi:hypothetical protein